MASSRGSKRPRGGDDRRWSRLGTGSSWANCRRRCASICPPPCSSTRPCDRGTDLGARACRPPRFDARPATPDRAPAGAGERRPGRQSGRRSLDMPMLDAYIPDGALSPSAERELLAKLTDLLLKYEGVDPTNEMARKLAWV